MPGNSFSQERSTYDWTPVISQTSAALYSLGVTSPSIARPPLRGRVLPPPPHVQPDRRSFEAERLPKLVHEEPLVGEMELRGDVGEEHEHGRRHTRLRG